MKKPTLRKIWWSGTIIYTAIIYTTLGVALTINNRINAFLGGRLNLLLYIVYSLISVAAVSYIVFLKKERSKLKYIALFLFIGAFIGLLEYTHLPAEKIHLIEYGLLGIFLYNALKIDLDRFGAKLYLCGALICTIIGAVDEVIQGFLPSRIFDWRDIFLNGASSALALLVIRVNILKRQS
jgi:hypothetical protein